MASSKVQAILQFIFTQFALFSLSLSLSLSLMAPSLNVFRRWISKRRRAAVSGGMSDQGSQGKKMKIHQISGQAIDKMEIKVASPGRSAGNRGDNRKGTAVDHGGAERMTISSGPFTGLGKAVDQVDHGGAERFTRGKAIDKGKAIMVDDGGAMMHKKLKGKALTVDDGGAIHSKMPVSSAHRGDTKMKGVDYGSAIHKKGKGKGIVSGAIQGGGRVRRKRTVSYDSYDAIKDWVGNDWGNVSKVENMLRAKYKPGKGRVTECDPPLYVKDNETFAKIIRAYNGPYLVDIGKDTPDDKVCELMVAATTRGWAWERVRDIDIIDIVTDTDTDTDTDTTDTTDSDQFC